MVPTKPEQVTDEWLTKVLQDATKKDIEVLKVEGHKNEGGVLSCVFKAVAQIDGQKTKLFIKTMPLPDQPQRVFIEDFGLDDREVETFTRILGQLETFEKETLGQSGIKSITCRFFAGNCCQEKSNRGFYVVMEDISSDYTMPDLDKGMSKGQIESALKKLAYLHALSYCYGQKSGKDFTKEYPMAYHSFLEGKDSQKFIEEMFKRAGEGLCKSNETQLAEILENMSKKYIAKFKIGYGGQDGRFITHGDMWSNNVMCHNSKDDCILIDWQFTCASSPYLDIAAMIYMSQDPDLVEKHSCEMLKTYLNRFEEICLAFQIKSPWDNFDSFQTLAYKEGYLSLFVWMLVSFSPCVYTTRILDRFIYVFKKAIQLNPEFFNE